ncbi:MAG TPA: hypothetical protein VGE54_03865 [Brevundimonas sp.]
MPMFDDEGFAMRRLIQCLAVLTAIAFPGHAMAQDEPAGGNAMSGWRYDESHGGASEVTVGMPYLEIVGWPQGSRRPVSKPNVLTRSAAILQSAGADCQVTDGYHPGDTRRRAPIFEVACAAGPGFLITAGDEPEVFNCLLLDAQEQARHEREPDTPVTNMCLLEGSRDAVAVLKPMAAAAGVTCDIDQALWIGRMEDVGDRYEVGCDGRSGAWLETAVNGAVVTNTYDCLEVVKHGETCRFTTADELTASVAALLPASGTPACSPTAGRLVGAAAGGDRYYELACSGGAGFIFRVRNDRYDISVPCAQAAGIMGGCRLE